MTRGGRKGFFHDVAGGWTAESERNLVSHGAIAAHGGRMRKEFARIVVGASSGSEPEAFSDGGRVSKFTNRIASLTWHDTPTKQKFTHCRG